MASKTILILGGALAGPTAAARARETDESARIILFERNRRVSYAQCGLSDYLSGAVPSAGDLDRERAEYFQGVYNVEVWTQAEAVHLDPGRRMLRIQRGGTAQDVGFDALVFALGAASKTPAGAAAENLVCFRTLDDLEAIEREKARGSREAVVLGGGPLGVEAACGLAGAGFEVTVIEQSDTLLPQFSPRMAGIATKALAARVRCVTGSSVARFEISGNRVTAVHLGDGRSVSADLVVAALGLEPRTGLLRDAGAKVAADGTIPVSARMETSLKGVFACGVCLSVPQAITGHPVWLAQGSLADKTAQVAGANAAGGEASLAPATGSMLVRAGDLVVGRTGLTLSQAEAFCGGPCGQTTVEAPAVESYLRGSTPILLELFWNPADGRILGLEAAGRSGVDKRIDAAAAAIAGGLTIDRLATLDFGYEPAFNAARDPLNVAATVAVMDRSGAARPARMPVDSAAQRVDVSAGGMAGPGTIHIPLERLRSDLARLDRSRPVVTLCETGRRSLLASRILAQHGFKDVRYVAGGVEGK